MMSPSPRSDPRGIIRQPDRIAIRFRITLVLTSQPIQYNTVYSIICLSERMKRWIACSLVSMLQYCLLAKAFIVSPLSSSFVGRFSPSAIARRTAHTRWSGPGRSDEHQDNEVVSSSSNNDVSDQQYALLSSSVLRGNISSLYSNQDLMEVMKVHSEYESQITSNSNSDSDSGGTGSLEQSTVVSSPALTHISSLHQLIEQTILKQQPEERDRVPPSLLEKSCNIRAISSDVDGTLLSSSTMQMHPRTRMAVKRAIQDRNCLFFPATGKSRRGAMDSLGPEIEELMMQFHVPGVYLQGLYCVDGQGRVLLERKLSKDAIAAAEEIAKLHGVSVVGYDGDDLYTTELTPVVVHLSDHYGEPMPRLLPATASDYREDIRPLSDHRPGMHKLLLMDEDVSKLDQLRPMLESVCDSYGASVTQALSTMLEWIPSGCSKAQGVAAVCSDRNIDPETELLALGDAENDAQMLEMAAIGVAMGNGSPSAKKAADYVMSRHCDEGGAGYAIDLFVFDR